MMWDRPCRYHSEQSVTYISINVVSEQEVYAYNVSCAIFLEILGFLNGDDVTISATSGHEFDPGVPTPSPASKSGSLLSGVGVYKNGHSQPRIWFS